MRLPALVIAAAVLALAAVPTATACPATEWSVTVDVGVAVVLTNCLSPTVYPFTTMEGPDAHAWHRDHGSVLLVEVRPMSEDPVHAESALLP